MVEKQLIIFREEALSLYDKLGRKTEEADMYQRMVRDMQRTAAFKENENRIMMKSIKNL